jgi:hypothetical protein
VTAKDRPRRPHRARVARMLAALAVMAGFLTGSAFVPGTAQASPCENGAAAIHRYGQDVSGSGSNKGTGAYMQTWAHWSIDGHTASDLPISNEAVWTIDANNRNDALEVGWKTGYVINTGTIDNNMYPYVTVNNDQDPPADEYDFTGTSLPTNTSIWNSATSDGTSTWAYINNTQYAHFASYGVSTPRQNYEQAEVNYQDIWMGGGSGSTISLYYQTPSNAWVAWGSQDAYTSWLNVLTGAHGYPAGYGYYSNPVSGTNNEVIEGGYGQTC